ncbi:MAG: Paraquat-inducible protein B [Burkholderia gladioli]|nr:MAG: Paraquat-inducible protein B [Burkholderia gladioli]
MNSPQGPQHDQNAAPPTPPNPLDLPDAVVARRTGWLPSLAWLVPLVAALIGIGLVVKSVFDRGPEITISFRNAEGLEPGKTQVKYASLEFRVGGFFRVKGGRSPAQRTLDTEKSTSTLEGSGQAKPCAAWPPSPSGGEDFAALGRG